MIQFQKNKKETTEHFSLFTSVEMYEKNWTSEYWQQTKKCAVCSYYMKNIEQQTGNHVNIEFSCTSATINKCQSTMKCDVISDASKCMSWMKSWKELSTIFWAAQTCGVISTFWNSHFVYTCVCLFVLLARLLHFFTRHAHYLAMHLVNIEDVYVYFLAFYFVLHAVSMILAVRQFPDSSNYFALNNRILKLTCSIHTWISSSPPPSLSFFLSLTHTHILYTHKNECLLNILQVNFTYFTVC